MHLCLHTHLCTIISPAHMADLRWDDWPPWQKSARRTIIKYTTFLLYPLHYTNDPTKALKTQLNTLRPSGGPTEVPPSRNYATESLVWLHPYVLNIRQKTKKERHRIYELSRKVVGKSWRQTNHNIHGLLQRECAITAIYETSIRRSQF